MDTEKKEEEGDGDKPVNNGTVNNGTDGNKPVSNGTDDNEPDDEPDDPNIEPIVAAVGVKKTEDIQKEAGPLEESDDLKPVMFTKADNVIKFVKDTLKQITVASKRIDKNIGLHKERIEKRQTKFIEFVNKLNDDLKAVKKGMELIRDGANAIYTLQSIEGGGEAQPAQNGGGNGPNGF